MKDPATIFLTIPRKENDPTEITYTWGLEAAQMAREFGYKVITSEGDDVTFDNTSRILAKKKVRVYSHVGHGCPNSHIGNTECVVTRKFAIEEIVNKALSNDPEIARTGRLMLDPMSYLSDPNICQLKTDPCNTYCPFDTNVHLLRNTISFNTACLSASQLGICAMNHGADGYVGFTDVYMFTVDAIGSQKIFKNIQLEGFKSLLAGHTLGETEKSMHDSYAHYIRKYKHIKWIALPLVFDDMHLKFYGPPDMMIYKG